MEGLRLSRGRRCCVAWLACAASMSHRSTTWPTRRMGRSIASSRWHRRRASRCSSASSPRLPPPLTRFIVPYIDVTHNRIPIEIMRGCTRGCRFCHAGMITRPVRERPVAEVVDAIEQGLAQTGYEEVGLLSLSSSDYTTSSSWCGRSAHRFAGRHLNIPAFLAHRVVLRRADGSPAGEGVALAGSRWRPKPPPSACVRSSTNRSAPQQLF